MALDYSHKQSVQGLAEGSVKRNYSSTGGGFFNFQIVSSIIEIGSTALIPFTGGASAAVGLAFATARLTENVASGRDFSVLGTVVDFVIPAGSFGIGKVVSAANRSADARTVLAAATATLEAGKSGIAGADTLLATMTKNIGISDELAATLTRQYATSDDVLELALQLGGRGTKEGQFLIGLEELSWLSNPANEVIQKSTIVKSVLEKGSEGVDLTRMAEMLEEGLDSLKLGYHDFRGIHPETMTDILSIERGKQMFALSETNTFLRNTGDVVARSVSNEQARRLMEQSGASIDDIKLVTVLLASATDQKEFNTILLGFVKTLDSNSQKAFLQAFLDNIKLSSDTFMTTGDVMIDITKAFDSAAIRATADRATLLAADLYVKEATRPSLLQRLLKVNANVDDVTGAVTYTKNMTNYQVFKGREFYDKVARRVQWLKPQDAARDVTTPIYRSLKKATKKLFKNKKVKAALSKIQKLDKIRDVFVAGGGQALDSSWILGYKLINEKANSLGKVLIMLYFYPGPSRNKDPVFIYATNKELIDFIKAPSPGQFYLDTWAIARNGKKGSSQKLNKVLLGAAGAGGALGLLPIQILRTLTSVISTLSRASVDVMSKGFKGFWDDYLDGFGQKILTNIATRSGRILGTGFGSATGSQLIRREAQRFSNLTLGQGLKNIIRGEKFFDSAKFQHSFQQAVFTGITTANRSYAGKIAGRGFSSGNSALQRIAFNRYANLAGGLVRSPFQGSYRPKVISFRF